MSDQRLIAGWRISWYVRDSQHWFADFAIFEVGHGLV